MVQRLRASRKQDVAATLNNARFRKSSDLDKFLEARSSQILKTSVRFSEADVFPLCKIANFKYPTFSKIFGFSEERLTMGCLATHTLYCHFANYVKYGTVCPSEQGVF